jgi:hypothetical protein
MNHLPTGVTDRIAAGMRSWAYIFSEFFIGQQPVAMKNAVINPQQ